MSSRAAIHRVGRHRPIAPWPASFALALAVASVVVHARPALACECGELDEAGAIEASAVVFDGWVLEVPQPWSCPLPPAPRSRKGCVRIAVVSRQDCKAGGDLLSLEASDGRGLSPTSVESDATTFCGLQAGRYLLAGSPRWLGAADNGTLDYGRALDLVPGGSYVVYGQGRVGQRLRVGVLQAIKGEVAREVVVHTEADCGTPFLAAGEALRFFGQRGQDGSVVVRGCSSVRTLTEAERAQVVRRPVAPAGDVGAPPRQVPSPPPPPAPAGASARGCAVTSASSGWLILVLLLGRRGARRRR